MDNLKTMTLTRSQLELIEDVTSAEYTGDFIDGVLLDNYMLSTAGGYIAVYEQYVNSNMSCYRIEYGDDAAVMERWQRFEAAHMEEA